MLLTTAIAAAVLGIFALIQTALRYLLGKAALTGGTVILGAAPFLFALHILTAPADPEDQWEGDYAATVVAAFGLLALIVLGVVWAVLRRRADRAGASATGIRGARKTSAFD